MNRPTFASGRRAEKQQKRADAISARPGQFVVSPKKPTPCLRGSNFVLPCGEVPVVPLNRPRRSASLAR